MEWKSFRRFVTNADNHQDLHLSPDSSWHIRPDQAQGKAPEIPRYEEKPRRRINC